MFESGAYVARHVEPLREGQVQPNGVDLTVTAVLEPTEPGRIDRGSKHVARRREVTPVAESADADSTNDTDGASGDSDSSGEPAEDAGEDDADLYRLEPGGYVLQYGERLAVPSGHVGFVLPRSSLMRNGATLETAVWDAGYEGRGEGLLQVHHPIEIRSGARVGQFVLAQADHEGTYDGTYQGERLE